jgi:ABC-2 type transport system ATP-binding protein
MSVEVEREQQTHSLEAELEELQREEKVLERRTFGLQKGQIAMAIGTVLALIIAIDAPLLVLDEPTLGLDLHFRKQFYDSLLSDYCDRRRTIVVTTHDADEIQGVLTDVMFIDQGRIVFACSMEELEARYREVMVNPENAAAARALNPIHERHSLGRSILLFERADPRQLARLGDVRTPKIADLFVSLVDNRVEALR